jgi:predicted LPLAT superfamily acyltransferase
MSADPAAEKPPVRWSGRSRGGVFGNWWFIQLIRCFGLRPAYAFLVLVAGYFTVFNPSGYRCSKDYLRRVLGPQPFWRWPLLVYRHFYSFGITLLDRVAVIMGRAKMEWTFENTALFMEQVERGQGVILLGAHVGSWELGGHLLGRLGKPVNVVNLLATDGHPLRSIPIAAALRRGEIVALLGDRPFGGADVRVPFLGGHARFPTGPYLLAAFTGAPIFQTFALRERPGHYRFFSYPGIFVPRAITRAAPEALTPYVTAYADRLAEVAKKYPFQWFNIFPFWDESR